MLMARHLAPLVKNDDLSLFYNGTVTARKMKKTYEFKAFPFVDGIIEFPKDTVFYRGINHESPVVLRDTPIYLSSRAIAQEYGKVHFVKSKDTLRLVDLRKLMAIMPMVIATHKITNAATLRAIYYLTVALGLCDYMRQIDMLVDLTQHTQDDAINPHIAAMKAGFTKAKTNTNPHAVPGVRVAITSIDAFVVTILSELFGETCDGFIAPELFSPFHSHMRTHEEIVVFKPTKKLKVTREMPGIETLPIRNIISSSNALTRLVFGRSFRMNMYISKQHVSGGGTQQDRNTFFDDPQKVAAARKLARAFARSVGLRSSRRHVTMTFDGPLPLPTLKSQCPSC